ncbi:hypothetical protein ACFLUY_00825 [Chloroflexota bacterium]
MKSESKLKPMPDFPLSSEGFWERQKLAEGLGSPAPTNLHNTDQMDNP